MGILLSSLVNGIDGCRITGGRDVAVSDIQYDSRKVSAGSLFVAVKGEKTDGNLFAQQAVGKGAVAVMTDEDLDLNDALIVKVPDARAAMARVAAAYFGEPSRSMKMVGITGTNGKTTTSFLIESILKEAGLAPGVIGTINYRYCGKVVPATHTTPESLDLQRILREMVDSGARSVVMEVSSHALEQERVGGCLFDAAVFTNLTQDHLDYHGTLEAYFKAKKRLFTDFIGSSSAAVINTDDPAGRELATISRGKVFGYGMTGNWRHIYPIKMNLGVSGTSGVLMTPAGEVAIDSPLVGEFNLYNIMGSVGAALGLGVEKADIEQGIRSMTNVPGRVERVNAGQRFAVLVDYAHTPDALDRVLSTVRGISDGRVIVAFGCGGDRDRGKRPIMGMVATGKSDFAIITSDNPRTEDPMAIIGEIEAGIREARFGADRYAVVPDRREAIRRAVGMAKENDVVVLAGKGHEDYQIIGTVKTHFDDREEAALAIKERLDGRLP